MAFLERTPSGGWRVPSEGWGETPGAGVSLWQRAGRGGRSGDSTCRETRPGERLSSPEVRCWSRR